MMIQIIFKNIIITVKNFQQINKCFFLLKFSKCIFLKEVIT